MKMKLIARMPILAAVLFALVMFMAGATAKAQSPCFFDYMDQKKPCDSVRITIWDCMPNEFVITFKVNYDDGTSVVYTEVGPGNIDKRYPLTPNKQITSVTFLGVTVPKTVPWSGVTVIPNPNLPGRCYEVDVRGDNASDRCYCPHVHIRCIPCPKNFSLNN